jgi:hypothetical protein
MLDALLLGTVLITGVWIGWTARSESVSTLKLLGFAALFYVIALAVYRTQCDAASIPDILLFRDVPGQFFCSGRLTLIGHAFAVAVPVSLVRRHLQKYMT